ncbi:MAG: 3-dehydroquinate synthase [Muribaculaceae bacterium]|nr:3-dehydroquinate synthase [Muribaculaceae bacterium]
MMAQKLIYTNHVAQELDRLVEAIAPSNIVVIVDSNTKSFVLPRMQAESEAIAKASVIEVAPGDANKNLESLSSIWKQMQEAGCNRLSLVINLGGGMVTDMGAFAASTFKRGVKFINVPTTLLAAVDASVGGKTGINYNGLKNEIGVFNEADAVIISSTFFNTLNDQEKLSGYGEMIKHALLSSKEEYESLLKHDVTNIDPDKMLELIKSSVAVKEKIVTEDPREKGLRKALNLGHTVGHAFEELSIERKSPIPHGYAVVFGIVCELILASKKAGFPNAEVTRFASYIKDTYGVFPFTCKEYDRLIALMHHDKKNKNSDEINFSLLEAPGTIVLDCVASDDEIKEAFDLYRELSGE